MRRATNAAGQWRTGWGGVVGRPLAVLAVFCQLLAAVLLPASNAAPTSAGAIVGTAGVICHADGGPAPEQDRAPVHHSAADCALCPHCLGAPQPPALAAAPPSVPAPFARRLAVALPPARAGPVAGEHRLASQPRGPPAPV